MNVTYIIGNGFDLNLGLKTSYKDFYEYYIEQYPCTIDEVEDENEKEIVKLKKSIQDSINGKNTDKANWADLELALGQYTSVFSAESEEKKNIAKKMMLSILDDIEKKLTAYLKKVEDQIQVSDSDSDYGEIVVELGNIEAHLTENNRASLRVHFGTNFNPPTHINIITLNYTSTIERLLNKQEEEQFMIPTRDLFGMSTGFETIHHLHNSLNGEYPILIGVNDESQIANETLREDDTLKEFLIKPVTNEMFGTGVDRACEQIIGSSHLIILFGVSMGATDKYWWNLIASRLLKESSSRLVIFAYDQTFSNQRKMMGEKRRELTNKFLSHSELSKDEENLIKGRIIVEFNKSLFNGLRNFIKVVDPA